MVLHPARRPLVICQDKVGAYGDDENPVVGLNDKDLCHEAVEAAEALLFGSADEAPVDIHGRRGEEVEGHDTVADGETTVHNESVGLSGSKGREWGGRTR